MKVTSLIVVLIVSAVLIASVPAGAAQQIPHAPQATSPNYALDAGPPSATSGVGASPNYAISATVGQVAPDGLASSPGYELCAGFACVIASWQSVFAPLIRRD